MIIFLFFYHHIESDVVTDIECVDLLSTFEKENKFKEFCQFDLIHSIKKYGCDGKLVANKCQLLTNLLRIIQTDDGMVTIFKIKSMHIS